MGMQRQLKKVAVYTLVGVLGVIGAIAVILLDLVRQSQQRPCWIPRTPDNKHGLRFFAAYLNALTNAVLAFAGQSAYFSVLAELQDTREFWKSLALLQSIVSILYIGFAAVFYHFSGDDTHEFALNQPQDQNLRRTA